MVQIYEDDEESDDDTDVEEEKEEQPDNPAALALFIREWAKFCGGNWITEKDEFLVGGDGQTDTFAGKREYRISLNLHFFIIIFPENNSEMMPIPNAFLCSLHNGVPEKAILESSAGRLWHVEICNIEVLEAHEEEQYEERDPIAKEEEQAKNKHYLCK
ncbi:hypothetical protein K1719_005020 [Acacia pycnantha]|nr:hypothetical protein K1719_005020 [Acacia pycnantha]